MTYQPRKPTQYGIEMKSMVCARSNVMLNMELVEGKERDERREFRAQAGVSTATSLCLAKPYKC